jgi:hypothetical protein
MMRVQGVAGFRSFQRSELLRFFGAIPLLLRHLRTDSLDALDAFTVITYR